MLAGCGISIEALLSSKFGFSCVQQVILSQDRHLDMWFLVVTLPLGTHDELKFLTGDEALYL